MVRVDPNPEFGAARSRMEFLTKSRDQTVALGKRLAKILKVNDVICLSGPLGAGKTTLVQGIAEGLRIKGYVTSPTFIVINEYEGRLPLYHVDLYRLNSEDEIEDLGIEEYFERGGVCVIEWSEKLGKLRPKHSHLIEMQVQAETERKICVSSALAARLP